MAEATPDPTRLPALLPTLLERVRREIHPRCEMYAFAKGSLGEEGARDYYFQSARFLVEHLLRELEGRARTPERLTLLDFASGYGRFTRFFVELFERVTVADVDPEMIEFARRTFGVEGFVSDLDPRKLTPVAEHDVVFVFSLFTHLPEALWHEWLRTLWGYVRPGGVLVFSARTPRLTERFAAGALTGTQVAVLAQPGRALAEHELHVYGVRVSLQGAERVDGLRGTLRIELQVSASESPRTGAVRLQEIDPRFGLAFEDPRARLEPEGHGWRLAIELPFRAARSLPDLPIGPVIVPLRFARPAWAGVADRAGSPTLVVRPARSPGASGFDFRPTNETAGRLDPACYGSTTVTPEFVEAAVAQLPGAGRLAHREGGAFDLHQDVFVVPREA